MSAHCSRSEMLSSFGLGCMRVAHRWVACEASDSGLQPCLHSGAVDSVTQATKAAKQWHGRAASVWEILCGQAEAVERQEKTEAGAGGR
jgi:hypothetical protein